MTEHMEWEDRITRSLTNLYRSYGYSRYRMEKFEPYELYMEHKNYIKDGVIAFPDNTGRLMALKPDVTLSVVRTTLPEECEKKVYYSENVYRMERDTQEYREIRQIGLEYIGGEGGYPEAETLLLAAKSLSCISDSFVLCISHMDIVNTILQGYVEEPENHKKVLQAIRRHRPHSLQDLNLPDDVKARLLTLISLPGNARSALSSLRSMQAGAAIDGMIDELESVIAILEHAGFGDRVRIDFSILNDTDYYNGLSFAGYLDGVPKAVLAGGRYDCLMQRFGKSQGGIGFALYVGELIRSFADMPEYDADILLIYGEASADTVLKTMRDLTADGTRVRACRRAPENFRAGRVITLGEDTI